MKFRVPEDFERTAIEGLPGEFVLRKAVKDDLAVAIAAHPEVFRTRAGPVRGGKARELRTASGWVVVRRYARGGFAAGLRRDLHWGCRRAFAELAVSEEAREHGIRTPEVVGIRTEEVWGPFCRMDLITRKVENARSLEEALKAAPDQAGRQALLQEVAAFARGMHDAGLIHADLHIRNILVAGDSGAARSLVLIDLDRGRFVRPAEPSLRAGNLFRLNRSLERFGVGPELFSARDRVRFLRAYQGRGRESLDQARRWMRDCETHMIRHRTWWKLFGKQGR